MTDLSDLPLYIAVPICLFGGLCLGYAYFRALRKTADLMVREGHPVLGLALTLGRIPLLAVVFFVAVMMGGAALLAAFAGVLGAKALILRRVRRDSI